MRCWWRARDGICDVEITILPCSVHGLAADTSLAFSFLRAVRRICLALKGRVNRLALDSAKLIDPWFVGSLPGLQGVPITHCLVFGVVVSDVSNNACCHDILYDGRLPCGGKVCHQRHCSEEVRD